MNAPIQSLDDDAKTANLPPDIGRGISYLTEALKVLLGVRFGAWFGAWFGL